MDATARIWGAVAVLVVVAAAMVLALWSEPEPDAVLYCGVDQDQSQPMVGLFEQQSGLTVAFHGESEAFRSVGLPQRLLRERDSPRADVYWSNEIMHMAHLAEAGLLDPLPDGVAESFPAAWRDPDGRFIQFGARARVLLVNTELLPDAATHPTSVADLLDPRWKEQGLYAAMAAPLTGTTLTHAVALLTKDEASAMAFYEAAAQAAKDGRLKVVASNGRVMRAVSDTSQNVAFGLTDTDDARIAIARGDPVRVVYPDQGEGQPGTLVIPNTAALVRGRPHPEAAERLLRWLASPETEQALAESVSAQIPVRPGVSAPAYVKRPDVDFRPMAVDWRAVGRNQGSWNDALTRLFRPVD